MSCCLRDGACRMLTEAQCDDFQAGDVDVALAAGADGDLAVCADTPACSGAGGVDSAPPTRTRPGAELVYVSECDDPEIDEHSYWVQRCTFHVVRDCQLIADEPRSASWPLNAWELGIDVPWSAAPSANAMYVVVVGFGYFAGEEVASCTDF
ncbi:MAG: hypothetical protein HYS27_11525 [Deltaproteobacteria bacterium]|nr:hypothetical protein [Deltaproteobacteria bacterium]